MDLGTSPHKALLITPPPPPLDILVVVPLPGVVSIIY